MKFSEIIVLATIVIAVLTILYHLFGFIRTLFELFIVPIFRTTAMSSVVGFLAGLAVGSFAEVQYGINMWGIIKFFSVAGAVVGCVIGLYNVNKKYN